MATTGGENHPTYKLFPNNTRLINTMLNCDILVRNPDHVLLLFITKMLKVLPFKLCIFPPFIKMKTYIDQKTN